MASQRLLCAETRVEQNSRDRISVQIRKIDIRSMKLLPLVAEGGESEPRLRRPSIALPSTGCGRPFGQFLTPGCASPAAFGLGCDPRPHLLASTCASPSHGRQSPDADGEVNKYGALWPVNEGR